eukprot:551930_1
MDGKIIVFVLLLLFCWLICTPLICYGGYQIYQKRHNQIILKRHPTITIISCIISFIGTAIYSPLFLCGFTFHKDSPIVAFYNYTSPFLFPLIVYSLFYLLFLRFWHLFFDIKWMQSSRSAEWKSFLSMDAVKSDWFLNNKHSYGNIIYSFKLILIPWSISIIIMTILEYIHIFIYVQNVFIQLLWSILNFLFFAIPTFTMIFVWIKTPKFKDPFFIVYESLMSFRAILLMFLSYIIIVLSPLLGATPYTRHLLGCIFGILLYTWLALFYTLYALKITDTDKNKRNQNVSEESITNSSNISQATPSTSTSITMVNTNINNKKMSIDDEMSNMLGSAELFDEFMNHLRNEFSSELLLCFCELVQFKNSIRNNDDEEMTMSKCQNAVLDCDFIPDSFIVYGKLEEVLEHFNKNNHNIAIVDEYDDNMIRGHLLYLKYMSAGSELQINLSHSQNNSLREQLSLNNNRYEKKK